MAFGRQVSREILVYSVGFFVAAGIQYLAVPVYTRLFAPAEFSQLALAQAAVTSVAGVAFVGGDVALSRFWFQAESDEARRALTASWIVLVGAITLACALVGIVIVALLRGDAFDDGSLRPLLIVGFVSIVPAQISRLLAQIFRNQFRPVAFSVSSIALGCCTLAAGLILVVWADLGVPGIMAGILVAETVVLLVRVAMLLPDLRGRVSWSTAKPLLLFGAPLVPATMSFWVMTSSDRIVIQVLAGPTDLGDYAVASSIASVFGILLVAVGLAWGPRIMASYASDSKMAAQQTAIAMRYLTLALCIIAAMMAAVSHELVRIVASDAYLPGAKALPLLLLGAAIYGTTVITPTGLLLMQRTRLMAWTAAGAAFVNVATAIALVPLFGIVGAALGSIAGFAFLTGLYHRASQRVWHAPIAIARSSCLFGVLAASSTVLTFSDNWSLLLRLGVLAVTLACLVVVAGIKFSEVLELRTVISGSRSG